LHFVFWTLNFIIYNDFMWQCKNCKERFIEKPSTHVCVDVSLKSHFKGRKALMEPIYRYFVQKISKIGNISAKSDGQNIVLLGPKPFAKVRITDDNLEICLKLPDSTPLPPNVHSAARLRMDWATHYFIINSVSDIGPLTLNIVDSSYSNQKG